ncbi:olfactory receptor 4B1-like protein [Cricetulus griseus]|nr:olfactory receptor 4B1-like protein [Cricetulus griseus]
MLMRDIEAMASVNNMTELIITGLFQDPEVQKVCFVLFLPVYLATVLGNGLIVVMVSISKWTALEETILNEVPEGGRKERTDFCKLSSEYRTHAECSAVDLCIYFHQFVDEGSLMTIEYYSSV